MNEQEEHDSHHDENEDDKMKTSKSNRCTAVLAKQSPLTSCMCVCMCRY